MNASAASAERVPVLMYHLISAIPARDEDRYCVAAARFEQHMEALHRAGYSACSMEAFQAWLGGTRALPVRTFLLTFDDGFLGVYEHAFPVLQARRWPFTVFLVSQLIGEADDWRLRDRRTTRAQRLLGMEQIREMQRAGVHFGSHSRSHADLPRLGAAALRDELAGSRAELEDALGCEVRELAYPYGRSDDHVITAARAAGYVTAFTTEPGFNRPAQDSHRVRRLDVYGADTAGMLLRKVELGSNEGSFSGLIRYYGQRALARVSAGIQKAAP